MPGYLCTLIVTQHWKTGQKRRLGSKVQRYQFHSMQESEYNHDEKKKIIIQRTPQTKAKHAVHHGSSSIMSSHAIAFALFLLEPQGISQGHLNPKSKNQDSEEYKIPRYCERFSLDLEIEDIPLPLALCPKSPPTFVTSPSPHRSYPYCNILAFSSSLPHPPETEAKEQNTKRNNT